MATRKRTTTGTSKRTARRRKSSSNFGVKLAKGFENFRKKGESFVIEGLAVGGGLVAANVAGRLLKAEISDHPDSRFANVSTKVPSKIKPYVLAAAKMGGGTFAAIVLKNELAKKGAIGVISSGVYDIIKTLGVVELSGLGNPVVTEAPDFSYTSALYDRAIDSRMALPSYDDDYATDVNGFNEYDGIEGVDTVGDEFSHIE